MLKLKLLLPAAIGAVLFAGAAQAADAAHAWGTISNPGAELLNSATMHAEEGQNAEIVAAGANGSGVFGSSAATTASEFPAATSCGTCTTITIQGDQNTISGTSITSTNSGTVTTNSTQ
jgi:opacity protein-like surface antigen